MDSEDLCARDPGKPVLASRVIAERRHIEEIEYLAKCEREHREIHADLSQTQRAYYGAEERSNRRTDRKSEQCVMDDSMQ